MIEGLRPYPEMAASTLPWVASLPAHWEHRRIKTLVQEVDRRTTTGEEKLLSLRMLAGLVGHHEAGGRPIPSEAVIGFKRIEPGQLVMNRMRAAIGLFGVAHEPGLVSPDYAVFAKRAEVDLHYLLRLFKLPALGAVFRAESKGLGTGQSGFLRLYTDKFGAIRIPLPPLDEQRLIVRFLDWHGAMTSKLIRAKRGVLTLIAEQREVLTRQALEDVDTQPMRFSRVANHVFRNVDRSNAPRFVTVGLFNRGRGIFHKPPLNGDELGQSTFSWVEDGDLIFSGQFAWEGAVAIAGPEEHGCIASHRYHIVRGDPLVASNTYLWCLFRSSLGQMLLNEHSRGAAGRNRPLNINYLLKEDIPVASRSHQAKLEEFVAYERLMMQEVADYVSVLQEFRTRLIADVVNGQLDVRAVAASLPDVAEGEAFADAADDMDDEDEDALDVETEDA